MTGKIIYKSKNDELEWLDKGINISILAPLCYERSYELKESRVVELMGQYIKNSKDLEGYDYINYLKELFEKVWVQEEFYKNKDDFLNITLPFLLKLDPEWFNDAEKMNLIFRVPSIDSLTDLDKNIENLVLYERSVCFQLNGLQEMSSLIKIPANYNIISKSYIDHIAKRPDIFKNKMSKLEAFWETEIMADIPRNVLSKSYLTNAPTICNM